ncbi:MAG: VWA domain-containing protein [Flavobacteriaceae bacterium]
MKYLALLLFLISSIHTYSQTSENTNGEAPIIFIYDASGSMWGAMDGKTKMEIAKEVLNSSVDRLGKDQKVGLVAYGHRKKGDCKDVEFLVPSSNTSKTTISRALSGIKPIGMTPLAYSATLVIDQLRNSKEKATIILVTDGIESCNGNICDVVKAAQAEGIDFKLHIVGFGLKEGEKDQLMCAAKAGNGNYYDAANAEGLSEVLDEAVEQKVDSPEGNVKIFAVKNGKPIDAYISAYDVIAKRKPINGRTYKDTVSVYLPPSTYTIEVKPLEGSDVTALTIEGVQSFDDKVVFKEISFDGGKVGIKTTNNGADWDCMVKIVDANGKTAAALRSYNAPKEAEVNPGTYKVTIQALAMEGMQTYAEIENVVVKPGQTTPVSYEFDSGNFNIFTKVGSENIDTVVTIYEKTSGTSVGGGRTYSKGASFLLNPGTYSVKVAPLGNYKDRATQKFEFELKKGETVDKSVNF